jgi:hypothetical protein
MFNERVNQNSLILHETKYYLSQKVISQHIQWEIRRTDSSHYMNEIEKKKIYRRLTLK